MRPILMRLGLCLALLSPAGARAADIETTATPQMAQIGCTLRLSGIIEEGDLERLVPILSVSPRIEDLPDGRLPYSPAFIYGFPFATHRLCLNSAGGSFAEALEMAEAMSRFRDEYGRPGIPMGVADGDVCESACSVLFMAGRYSWIEERDSYWMVNRILHPRGRLGFHAPFILPPEGMYSAEQLREIWQLGMRTVSRLLDQVAIGSVAMNDRTISVMLETLEPDMRHVATVGDSALFDILVLPNGIPPRDVVQRRTNACDNAAIALRGTYLLDRAPGSAGTLSFRTIPMEGGFDEGPTVAAISEPVYRDARSERGAAYSCVYISGDLMLEDNEWIDFDYFMSAEYFGGHGFTDGAFLVGFLNPEATFMSLSLDQPLAGPEVLESYVDVGPARLGWQHLFAPGTPLPDLLAAPPRAGKGG